MTAAPGADPQTAAACPGTVPRVLYTVEQRRGASHAPAGTGYAIVSGYFGMKLIAGLRAATNAASRLAQCSRSDREMTSTGVCI